MSREYWELGIWVNPLKLKIAKVIIQQNNIIIGNYNKTFLVPCVLIITMIIAFDCTAIYPMMIRMFTSILHFIPSSVSYLWAYSTVHKSANSSAGSTWPILLQFVALASEASARCTTKS